MTDDDVVEERPRTALAIAFVLLVLAAGFVWVLAGADPSTDRVVSSPLLGKPAPAVESQTVDGEPFTLAAGRGRFLVVNFFATWCTPCQEEHPELVAFEEAHAAQGDVSLVSVVFDDQADTVRDFFAEKGGDWPVVTDPDGRIAFDYGVAQVPETYVVGPDGRVLAKLTGGVTAAGLERLFEVGG
jgi:cytochrome c biogenesis protein CcmG/thiol:disulfide interchange protein DsbE